MKRRNRHRLWIAGVTTLVLCAFLAGTSFACFQKGSDTAVMAEHCCQSHCQHAMAGGAATDCCQSHHTQTSPPSPTSPPAKTLGFALSPLPVALIPSPVLQSLVQPWVHRSIEDRSAPFPPLYTLHCTLLI